MAALQNDPDDEPLDPKVEAIRQKMMRLLFVSGGIMMLGLMAVVIAIVYKINQDSEQAASRLAPPVAGEIALPAGAKILSTTLSSTRIMLTIELTDGTRVIRIHDMNGNLISQFTLK